MKGIWGLGLAVMLVLGSACGSQSNQPPARQAAEQNQPAKWVTMDGYDASAGLTIREINLWRNYEKRENGISGHAAHGERVKLIRRSGNGVLVETASGQRGWVTYYFIKELK